MVSLNTFLIARDRSFVVFVFMMSRMRGSMVFSMLLFIASLYTSTCSNHIYDAQLYIKFTQHGVDSLHSAPSFLDTIVSINVGVL